MSQPSVPITDWETSFEDFKEKYKLNFPWGAMVGSLVYGATFKPTSDIDLLIGINSVDEWEYACCTFLDESLNSEFIQKSRKLYSDGKGEYFCLKFQHHGIDYSVDFFTSKFIDKMFSDLEEPEDVTYYKLTNKPQRNSYLMVCGDSKMYVPKDNQIYGGGVIGVSSPLFVQENERFYAGIMLDKLLTGYEVMWPNNGFNNSLELLCTKALERMCCSPGIQTLENAFKNLARYERLPQTYIQKQVKHYQSMIDAKNV